MPQSYIDLIKAVVHHPIAWLASAGFAASLGRRCNRTLQPPSWLLPCLSVAVLLYTITYCIAYLLYPTFTDHVEATITSNSAYLMNGLPLYHSPSSEEWYSIIYGPWLFIAIEGAYRIFGPSILSSKIPGIVCFVVALAIFGVTAQRRWGPRQAILAAGLFCAVTVIFARFVLSNRGDAFFILSSSIGLSLLWTRHRRCAMLLLGVMAGISAGIKLHGFAYLLPAAITISSGLGKHWWHGCLLFCLAALLLFWFPFLSSNLISWNNLVAHIRLSANHGLDSQLLLLNGQLLGLFFLSAFAAALLTRASSDWYMRSFPREIVWLIAANAVTAVLVLYPASKEGGGPHHILPLMPYLIYGIFEVGRHASFSAIHGAEKGKIVLGVASGFATICLAVGIFNWHRGLEYFGRTWAVAVEARSEVEHLAETVPQGSKLVMVFGDARSYWLTWYRPILVFHSHPIGIDPVAAMDLRKADLPIPLSYLRCDKHERNNMFGWIFPRNGAPLSMENYYRPHDRIADPDLFIAFAKQATPTIKTKHFTVWQCRG